MSEDGKYLYVSVREENKIYVYGVNEGSITLTDSKSCYGDSPRDFDLIDGNLVICNEKSNNVIVVAICDGLIGEKIGEIGLSHPICVVGK